MILATLDRADRYAGLHVLFPKAFAYLRETDLAGLAPGRYPIVGESLFVIIEEAQARCREAARLECHRRYIDIQLVLAGRDTMGWRPVSACREVHAHYSEQRDIAFFSDEPYCWLDVPDGAFCIFFPEDAHAPLVGEGAIRKAVVKVAVE